MQLIEQIKQYKSVSIVGMAKNTGKTTCLNFILKKLAEENYKIAVTSIGVDGEERDVLYNTLKPRIIIYKDNIFVTSEKHFEEKQIDAKIIHCSKEHTALGRLIIAEAKTTGQVILSGPSDSVSLSEYISNFIKTGIKLTLVDGALNRMSLASPSVTEAMILCTGAACSIKLDQLIKKVKYQCELIDLQDIDNSSLKSVLISKEGVWGLSYFAENYFSIEDIKLDKLSNSLFSNNFNIASMLENYRTIYVSGALTESFLKETISRDNVAGLVIIVRDFSHIFATQGTYYKYIRRGGTIKVLQKTNLLAICSNPTSPDGRHYVSSELKEALAETLQLPVYDIMQEEKNMNV